MKKLRATTALSIVGVMTAGGVAYALNVNVLGSSEMPKSAATMQVAPTGTDPVTTPVDGTVSVKEVSNTGTTTTYQVGDAGTLIVDTSSGQVTISSVVPNTGWSSEPARVDGTGSAKVHFVSGSTRIEVVVQMVNGAPMVTASVDTPQGPSAPGITSTKPTMPGSSVGDDDESDDEGDHRSGDSKDDGDGHDSEHEDENDD